MEANYILRCMEDEKSVLVTGIQGIGGCREDKLELHFGRRSNSGGDVDKVYSVDEDTAVVTFEDKKVAASILRSSKYHVVANTKVSIESATRKRQILNEMVTTRVAKTTIMNNGLAKKLTTQVPLYGKDGFGHNRHWQQPPSYASLMSPSDQVVPDVYSSDDSDSMEYEEGDRSEQEGESNSNQPITIQCSENVLNYIQAVRYGELNRIQRQHNVTFELSSKTTVLVQSAGAVDGKYVSGAGKDFNILIRKVKSETEEEVLSLTMEETASKNYSAAVQELTKSISLVAKVTAGRRVHMYGKRSAIDDAKIKLKQMLGSNVSSAKTVPTVHSTTNNHHSPANARKSPKETERAAVVPKQMSGSGGIKSSTDQSPSSVVMGQNSPDEGDKKWASHNRHDSSHNNSFSTWRENPNFDAQETDSSLSDEVLDDMYSSDESVDYDHSSMVLKQNSHYRDTRVADSNQTFGCSSDMRSSTDPFRNSDRSSMSTEHRSQDRSDMSRIPRGGALQSVEKQAYKGSFSGENSGKLSSNRNNNHLSTGVKENSQHKDTIRSVSNRPVTVTSTEDVLNYIQTVHGSDLDRIGKRHNVAFDKKGTTVLIKSTLSGDTYHIHDAAKEFKNLIKAVELGTEEEVVTLTLEEAESKNYFVAEREFAKSTSLVVKVVGKRFYMYGKRSAIDDAKVKLKQMLGSAKTSTNSISNQPVSVTSREAVLNYIQTVHFSDLDCISRRHKVTFDKKGTTTVLIKSTVSGNIKHVQEAAKEFNKLIKAVESGTEEDVVTLTLEEAESKDYFAAERELAKSTSLVVRVVGKRFYMYGKRSAIDDAKLKLKQMLSSAKPSSQLPSTNHSSMTVNQMHSCTSSIRSLPKPPSDIKYPNRSFMTQDKDDARRTARAVTFKPVDNAAQKGSTIGTHSGLPLRSPSHVGNGVPQQMAVKPKRQSQEYQFETGVGVTSKTSSSYQRGNHDDEWGNSQRASGTGQTSNKTHGSFDVFETTIQNVNVIGRKGDIMKEFANVIVCSANNQLKCNYGLVGKISSRCGPRVQAQCDDWIRDHGYVGDGEVVWIDIDDGIACSHMINAVVPRWNGHGNGTEELLLKMFLNIFTAARDKLFAHSIVLPLLGTVSYGIPHHVLVKSFIKALLTFLAQPTIPLQEIRIVDFDERAIRLIETELKRANTAHGYSKPIASPRNNGYSYASTPGEPRECLQSFSAKPRPKLAAPSNDDEECPVCWGALRNKKSPLYCSHECCGNCFRELEKTNGHCPICRGPLK